MLTVDETKMLQEMLEAQGYLLRVVRLHSAMFLEILSTLKAAGIAPAVNEEIDRMMKEFER